MLNIARQIYAGYDTIPTADDLLPEAEIIPVGESSNEKKKIEKFTSAYKIIKEYDNIPLPGYTLHKTNRAKWGSIDPTWLIIDPRGFLARITQDNLEKILHVTGITEGLIQEPCVWARENTNTKMSLIPVSSPSYLEAVANTELIESKVSLSEVRLGDKVMLQSGLTGVYLGVLSLYAGLYDATTKNPEMKAKTYLRRQIIQTDTDKFHYQTDAKILKVIEKTAKPFTRDETAEIMNNSIASGKSYFSSDPQMNMTRYFSRDFVRLVSTDAVQAVNLTIEEITKIEATKLFYDGQTISDSGLLILEKADGKCYLIDHPWLFSSGPKNTVNDFQVIEIFRSHPKDKIVIAGEKRYYSRDKGPSFGLDNFVKFYKIVKHVKHKFYV